jgi:hypothetical protein
MRSRANLIVFWIVVLSSMALMLVVIIRPDLAPSWSGMGQSALPEERIAPAKTLWDWLQLLAIPLFLAGAAWWVANGLRATGREHAASEQDLAAERRHQTTLDTYYDSMTALMVDGYLRGVGQDANVRHVAQARTLAVLRSLDGRRKGDVLQFLYDSGLIGKKPIIHLKDADLRKAQLAGANLCKAQLWLADLTGADLTGADLDGADLWLVDLRYARLRGATLRGAHLGGANLFGADLYGADLTGANLRKTILDGANLLQAVVTVQQLSRAQSLRRLRLPNGRLYDGSRREQ